MFLIYTLTHFIYNQIGVKYFLSSERKVKLQINSFIRQENSYKKMKK